VVVVDITFLVTSSIFIIEKANNLNVVLQQEDVKRKKIMLRMHDAAADYFL
jgi:hypothetical protein